MTAGTSEDRDPAPTLQAMQAGPPDAAVRRDDWLACLFVWAVLAVMTAALAGWLVKFHGAIPFWDDWGSVPALTGAEPLTWHWLWAEVNNHRTPITRLVMVACFRLSGGTFPLEAMLNVGLLGLAVLGLTLAARRWRGRMSYADAFFPLILLHYWANVPYLQYSFGFYVSVAVSVFLVLLLFFGGSGRERGLVATTAAALGLVVLPLLGAVGLSYTPALVVTAVAYAVPRRRSNEMALRREGLIVLVAAMVAAAVVGFVLIGYRGNPPQASGSVGFGKMLVTMVEAGSMGFGAIGPRAWPVTGIAAIFLTLAAVGLLAAAWRKRPDQRVRAACLFLLLGAAWMPAVAIGIGRAGMAGGAAPRYILMGVPILVVVYFAWMLYAPAAIGRFVQMGLFAIFCAFSAYHASMGIELGKARREAAEALLRDIDQSVPITGLVGRHGPYWCWAEPPLARGLEALRAAGVGPFARIQPDPPMSERTLGVKPDRVDGMVSSDGAWSGTGRESTLTYKLEEPTFVYAVRLKFELDNKRALPEAHFEALWPKAERPPEPADPWERFACTLKIKTGPRPRTQTVWIGQEIDRFFLRPDDGPFTLRLEEITLLVPSEETP